MLRLSYIQTPNGCLKNLWVIDRVYGLVLGGISLLIAGLCTLRVAEPRAGALVVGLPAQQA